MPSDHPTVILLSVHKGASTFLTNVLAPRIVAVFPGMRHVAVHQEVLNGTPIGKLALPPTGVVASRVYPNLYDEIIEDPVPAGGRFADKKLVMLRRDPRDVAVSFYYSFAFSHTPPPGEGRHVRKFHARRESIRTMDLPTGIVKYTARPAIKQFLATIDFLDRYPQTLLTTYEELVTTPRAWLDRVGAYMDWSDEVVGAIGAHLDDELSPPHEEDPYRHKRRVVPGNWREAFTPRLNRLFEAKLGHHLIEAGYEW
jgi:hypothetical protein